MTKLFNWLVWKEHLRKCKHCKESVKDTISCGYAEADGEAYFYFKHFTTVDGKKED